MPESAAVSEAIAAAWAGEIAGVSYFRTLGERFPEHRYETEVLALVEETMRDLIAPVADEYGVLVDEAGCQQAGVTFAELAQDWPELLEQALAAAPDAMRPYEALAAALPDGRAALGTAAVTHENAILTWFKAANSGNASDWAAIDDFLEAHGAKRSPIE